MIEKGCIVRFKNGGMLSMRHIPKMQQMTFDARANYPNLNVEEETYFNITLEDAEAIRDRLTQFIEEHS